ncbi:MAG: SpoIIE family protein phosphatase [bacterium]|nr:SpoIIE family protein phosphatase [bacterium]
MLNGSTVRHIATAIHTPQATDSLLDTMREIFISHGLPGAYTLLFTDSKCVHGEVYTSTLPGLKTGDMLEVDPETLANCIQHGTPKYFEQLQTVAYGESAIQATALYPLRTGDENYGAILLHEPIPEIDRERFEFILEQLGLALWRVQLGEELQHRHAVNAARLSAIAQAGGMFRGLDLDVVLTKSMELALSTMGAEAGCIMLLEGTPPTLSCRVEWGLNAEMLDRLRFQDGKTVLQTVIDTGQPIIIHRMETENPFLPDPIMDRIDNLAVIPFTARKHTFGCLAVVNFTVFGEQDLELLQTVVELSSTAVENARLHHQVLEREALREKLRIAGEIQYGLLPQQQPTLPGVALAARNIPCDESSGDYFDFFLLDDHRLGFVVGDATGHGIGAALITTTVRAFLRALINTTQSPAQLFNRLNNLAVDDFRDGKFITLFFGVYDTRDKTMTYASAGHNPPLMIYRHQQDQFECLKATGLPLGILAETSYEQHTTAPLEVGDFMLLLTDGVHESTSETGEIFGQARLMDVVKTHHQAAPADLIDVIYVAVCLFCGAAPQKDDITLLCLRATEA